MLRPTRMTKIRICGPQTRLSSLIRLLYSLKLVHLLDHKKTEAVDIGKPLAHSERISGLLIKIHSLLSSFEHTPKKSGQVFQISNSSFSLDEIEQRVTLISEGFVALHAQTSSLQKCIAEKQNILAQMHFLSALNLQTDGLQPYTSLASFIGTLGISKGIEHDISHITKHYHLAHAGDALALFVPREYTEKIMHVLQKHNFKQQQFSDLSSYTGTPQEEAQKLQVSLSLLEKDFYHIQTEFQRFQLQHEGFLHSAESFLKKEAEQAQAPLRFAETRYSFILEGWVSADQYQQLKHRLEKETDNTIHLEVLEISKKDKVPIIMKNMFFVKPIEFFLELYTLPIYKELDPSFFMFLTFPFFFGLMLGDVGYGFVTLIIFLLLWRKMPKARALLTVMIYSSLISIAFGFVYGEYFGFEHVSKQTGEMLAQWQFPLHYETLKHGEAVYSFPRLMNRLHGEITIMGNTLPTVLVIGAIIGFIHVNLGIFLGFINEVIAHGLKQAFFAKISWYILELGAALLALSSLGMIPFHWALGMGVVILAAVLLFFGEGIQGLVELPSLLTNILSYLRLGAVGLASVGLAVVINENLALPFMEKGGIFIAVSLLILITGHLINIALGVIGPFLHSLRLHYVEFFSKFYKGGGIPFVAFGEEK